MVCPPFTTLVACLAVGASTTQAAAAAPPAPAVFNPAQLPFNFTYLFSAHLNLGKPLPRINIPGGVLVAEPIINGTVSGPAFNGSVSAGIATPAVYNNGSTQVPVIRAWGQTADGVAFVLNEMGTGTPKAQVTRIQLDIGGGDKYAAIRDGYILATVNPNADQTQVVAHGYLVGNIGSFS